MLTPEERIFSNMCREVAQLSGCPEKQGALLIDENNRIIGHGFNRAVVPNLNYEISAVFDLLSTKRSFNSAKLFMTYFPTMEDFKLIIINGIRSIYFFGDVKDLNVVTLLNSCPKGTFDITQLN